MEHHYGLFSTTLTHLFGLNYSDVFELKISRGGLCPPPQIPSASVAAVGSCSGLVGGCGRFVGGSAGFVGSAAAPPVAAMAAAASQVAPVC